MTPAPATVPAPALAQPYQHLVKMLTTFAANIHAANPSGPHSDRWSRVAAHLDQELHQLHAFTQSPRPDHAALKQTVVRLTQLARTQDGLRLEHSTATPPTELADQRRLVVFAAWQLLQALDHAATLAGTK